MTTRVRSVGVHTSEFWVMLLNVIVQLLLALSDTLSNGTAARLGVAGTIAYVISRGLAKYEGRPTVPPQVPPQA